jgi:cobalt-zinc-cadmium efflux system protein
MSTTEIALTAHLVMPAHSGSDTFLYEVCDHLQSHFGIDHSTIQIERNAAACSLA